jgi:hypothetical protein
VQIDFLDLYHEDKSYTLLVKIILIFFELKKEIEREGRIFNEDQTVP